MDPEAEQALGEIKVLEGGYRLQDSHLAAEWLHSLSRADLLAYLRVALNDLGLQSEAAKALVAKVTRARPEMARMIMPGDYAPPPITQYPKPLPGEGDYRPPIDWSTYFKPEVERQPKILTGAERRKGVLSDLRQDFIDRMPRNHYIPYIGLPYMPGAQYKWLAFYRPRVWWLMRRYPESWPFLDEAQEAWLDWLPIERALGTVLSPDLISYLLRSA